jgi:hypothetical protein
MTGRRLYDLYCDAHRQEQRTRFDGGIWFAVNPQVAWPFLTTRDQRMWNAVAPRLKGVKRS